MAVASWICTFVVFIAPVIAKAKCVGPIYPTHCVEAKVLRALKSDPKVVQQFSSLKKKVCRPELSTPGFRGAVDLLVNEDKSCPVTGEMLLGDLVGTNQCNDAGQQPFRPTFMQKTSIVCKNEKADRVREHDLAVASRIEIIKTVVEPAALQRNYSLAANNLSSYRDSCAYELLESGVLSVEKTYKFEVSYDIIRVMNKKQNGIVEDLVVADLGDRLPQTFLECFRAKILEAKRSYIENVWFDLPKKLRVRSVMRFGKR